MTPEVLSARGRFGNPHMAKESYIRNCEIILSISNSALKDAKRIYNLPNLEANVTHLANSNVFVPDSMIQDSVDTRYLLFVGNRNGYKSGELLIEAFSKLKGQGKLNLLFVGGGKFSKSEKFLIGKLGISDRVFQQEATDSELSTIYRQACLYIMPSLYEGFGLPVLEAMASKCPVLTSDSSSLPEVGGQAAHYFTPGDANSLAEKIGEIISNHGLMRSMIEAGSRQAKNFSWEKCAQETANAYRGALEFRK
jgi:glycosyltransferase involved in cell wall biosynthesis